MSRWKKLSPSWSNYNNSSLTAWIFGFPVTLDNTTLLFCGHVYHVYRKPPNIIPLIKSPALYTPWSANHLPLWQPLPPWEFPHNNYIEKAPNKPVECHRLLSTQNFILRWSGSIFSQVQQIDYRAHNKAIMYNHLCSYHTKT